MSETKTWSQIGWCPNCQRHTDQRGESKKDKKRQVAVVTQECQRCHRMLLNHELPLKEKIMARVTRRDIRAKVNRLQQRGCPIIVEWAYGRPAIYQLNPEEFAKTGALSRHLSPRLPTGQMLTWLEAFEEGLEIANHLLETPILQDFK